MSADDKLFGPGRKRAFAPFLAPGERGILHAALGADAAPPPAFADELRSLARRFIDDGDSLKLRTICLLVADLHEQGWRISVEANGIVFEPPGLDKAEGEVTADIKARVRRALQSARARQLAEPAVRDFLIRVERSILRRGRKGSVLDLVDDGAALSEALMAVSRLAEADQAEALRGVIDPVVEVVEPGAVCPDTGLLLGEIWRYFRHTWAHEYRSIPGRQMMLLVRNRARPNRPVMGIAMLASPVMRLAARDQWVGWLRDAAADRLNIGEWSAEAFAGALQDRIEVAINALRWDDLAQRGEIAAPTETVVMRLEQRAAGAAAERDHQLRKHYLDHKDDKGRVRPFNASPTGDLSRVDWRAASEDILFVRKRSEGLSRLLFAKSQFQALSKADPSATLESLFTSRDGQRALDIALTEVRKAGLSSQVADVSICGAVNPYNELLGGKLTALLLCSDEVRDAYAARYGGQVSVIASQMAGQPIVKPADLQLLTTTSLYGVGSSQYNRLVLRASEHPELDHDIRWGTIGQSLTGGYGTHHLSQETGQALRTLALTRHDARRVNNRFGEGTSPRLRQMREGLDALGLKSDAILHHATPRIFYGCELHPNARDVLMGLASSPAKGVGCDAISEAWRTRWVLKRIRRPETHEALAHLGPVSVRANLHADLDGQFLLPIG
nr:Druantia anti-phage system protein DruA [uncultured Brevundimonas sp.]